jgi:hypothetical protein
MRAKSYTVARTLRRAIIGTRSWRGVLLPVRARSTYGDNLERLIEVETKYDPKNLFHLNPNITPRTARTG